MILVYVVYALVCAGLIVFFVRRSEKKLFMAIVLTWIFGYAILGNPQYMLSFSALGFDLQPNRLLFIVLSLMALWLLARGIYLWIFKQQTMVLQLDLFDVCLIAYFLSTVLAYAINLSSMQLRVMVANITNLMPFLLVFFFARKYVTKHDLSILASAFLVLGLFSSLVGVYQFFVDPQFLRMGLLREAFSSYVRAVGLFDQEYEMGMFLCLAFVMSWEVIPNWLLRTITTVIFALGVFTTMHRLSWIIFIISFLMVWLLSTQRRNYMMSFVGVTVTAILCIVISSVELPFLSSSTFFNDMIYERITVDNLTIRVNLNEFALKMIQKYPFGIGEYETETYQQEGYSNGIGFGSDFITSAGYQNVHVALAVHNGFLGAGVRYGIIGMTTFVLIFIGAIFFYLRHAKSFGQHWHLPIMIVLIYLLFNTTNDFSFFGRQLPIVWSLLLGAFAAQVDFVSSTARKDAAVLNELVYEG